jgi:hypothetical protein
LKQLAVTPSSRSLEDRCRRYFAAREGEPVSLADLCAYLNIALEEWGELAELPETRRTVKRVETRLRAAIERDVKRPAALTSLLLKQLYESEPPHVEFMLTILAPENV